MKTKDKASYRAMDEKELEQTASDLSKKIVNIRLSTATQVKNVREGRELRRRLAVVQTIRKEKEITHE